MEFSNVINERRAATFFDPKKDLDISLLEEIIDEATLAPSCFNTQPWEVVVINSKEAREELFEKACKQPKVKEAPVTLAIIGKRSGYDRSNPVWDEKIKNGYLDEEKLKGILSLCDSSLFATLDQKTAYAARNSSLLAMSIMYVAKNKGVASHPMIGFDEGAVKKLYDIQEENIVTMLISMGYPHESKELYPREKRFSFKEISRVY